MVHTDVYKLFKLTLPTFAEKMTEYFPNGKNSIRVRNSGARQEYVFTVNGANEWRFETIDSFLKYLKNK